MASLTVEQQYYSALNLVQEQIKQLNAMVKEHKSKAEAKKKEVGQQINYGHVGDMLHVADQIGEALRFLG